MRDCLTVNIVDDQTLEGVESFILSLSIDTEITAVVLSQKTVQIRIVDNDGMKSGAIK